MRTGEAKADFLDSSTAVESASVRPAPAPLELLREGDVLLIRSPGGSTQEPSQTLAFHGREMQVAAVGPEIWSGLVKRAKNQMAATKPLLRNGRAHEHPHEQLTRDESEALEELRTWNKSDSQTTRSGRVTPAIRSLTINVAQICNLACTYCAAGGDGTYGSNVKTPELDRVRAQLGGLLRHVPEGERFIITFLGGEPLIYPDVIRKIVRDARLLVAGRRIRLQFDIVTNGTLVTPEIAEMLADMSAHVTVSLDGAPQDNDRARVTKSGRGSSTMVLKGLSELVRVKPRLGSLTAGAVFGRHNLNVIAAWKFLREYPFDALKFDFAAETDDDESSREFARQYAEIADLAFELGGETELRRLHTYNHLFHTLDDRIRIENHCLAGKSHLQMDTDGKFTVCQWFVGQKEEEVGEGLTLDLSERNERLHAFSAPLIEKNGCGTCWARHICGGGCMYVNKVKTGNKHKVDQAFCERTRTITAKGIERYAKARYQHTQSLGDDGSRTEDRIRSEVH
ncbi:MAG: radical SAM protein [Bdellovibrionales bacterium]|jgi:uncharacterized protein|nr:radical SAM protein [Bdellovibrionales bacterium]